MFRLKKYTLFVVDPHTDFTVTVTVRPHGAQNTYSTLYEAALTSDQSGEITLYDIDRLFLLWADEWRQNHCADLCRYANVSFDCLTGTADADADAAARLHFLPQAADVHITATQTAGREPIVADTLLVFYNRRPLVTTADAYTDRFLTTTTALTTPDNTAVLLPFYTTLTTEQLIVQTDNGTHTATLTTVADSVNILKVSIKNHNFAEIHVGSRQIFISNRPLAVSQTFGYINNFGFQEVTAVPCSVKSEHTTDFDTAVSHGSIQRYNVRHTQTYTCITPSLTLARIEALLDMLTAPEIYRMREHSDSLLLYNFRTDAATYRNSLIIFTTYQYSPTNAPGNANSLEFTFRFTNPAGEVMLIPTDDEKGIFTSEHQPTFQ